jgi:ABC-type Fe3+/spermidine/putrescine transport system ATPase subunit
MRIELKDLRKAFGDTTVIDGVSLSVGEAEMFFLLGPSGCGKTTLLRIVAGFLEPDAGEVLFDGRSVNGVPPEERRTPMVFQSYALWPHLSVFENVAYGLRLRKTPETEVRRRVGEALEATRMQDFAARPPNQLSGGQQQRVAISRALAVDPPALLFDEPLSNLDARLRLEMRDEIREIHRRRPFTALYVTHDQEEAMTLATRIAVMDRGAVRQVGAPTEVYAQPADRFVAEFMGTMNWLPGKLVPGAAVPRTVETRLGAIRLAPGHPALARTEVFVGFRPAAVRLEGGARGGEFTVACEVVQAQFHGPAQRLWLKPLGADDLPLQAVETNPRRLRPAGETLTISVAAEDLILLPK